MLISEAIATNTYPLGGLERRPVEAPPTIDELLGHRRQPLTPGWMLDFDTPFGADVYNSSAPMYYGDKRLVVVREENGDEFSSQNRFFSLDSGNRFNRETDISNLAELSAGWICQDPASSYVHGNWVITQVQVSPESLNNPFQDVQLQSAIYGGRTLDNLSLIARSPGGMKGVRPIELLDHRVGVFTRPQFPGEPTRGGLGKIGFTIVESLDQINSEILAAAPLIPELASNESDEWYGVNDSFLLPNGDLAVLAHQARFETSEIKDSRGYYPVFFTYNPDTGRVNNLQVLATIADFTLNGQVKAKRPDLENVFYPSHLCFPNDDIGSSWAMLMGGIKDSKMAAIYIPNPLAGWLETHPQYAAQSFDHQLVHQIHH